MKSYFTSSFLVFIFFSFIIPLQSQNLEIDGGAKINSLTLNNSAPNVLVVLPDGSIGIREATSIGGGGGGGGGAFIVGGGSAFNGFGTADNFVPMGSSVRANSYDEVKTRVPMSGTLTSFEGAIKGATPAGSYTFTVLKNGGNTGLECTITGSATACTDLADCVSFTTGDFIAVRYTGSGATNREGRWSAIFTAGGTCP